MARIQCHIIRVAEANGATSGCLVSVKNMTYQLSSPYWMKSWVSEIVARDKDLSETQRPLGPARTREEAEQTQNAAGPCGPEGLLELLL
jgi:hypothetical protein